MQALRTSTVLEKNSSETCEIFKNILYWASPVDVSDSFTFPPSNFIKKEILAKMIFCEFCKISKKIFDRALPDDYFLSLSVNCEKFFRTSLLQSVSEKLLISCTSCSISTSRYSEKLFYRCCARVLYKNEM